MKYVYHPKLLRTKPTLFGLSIDDIAIGVIIFFIGLLFRWNALVLLASVVMGTFGIRLSKKYIDYKAIFLPRIKL